MTSVKMVLDKVHWTEDIILNPEIVALLPWASQITMLNKIEIMGYLK